MRGCLKLIFSMVFTGIVGIALLIFYLFGGVDYVKGYIDSLMNPPKNEIEIKAQKLGDFSKLSKEYKLTRAVDMLGVNAVVAEHKQTNQNIALVDPGVILKVTKNDIKQNTLDNKIKEVANRFNNLPIKLGDIQVTKKGTFKALNQDVPYAKVKIQLSGAINKDLEGIIGIASTSGTQNNLVVSMNEPGKYNQKVTEGFLKNIKLKKQEDN